MSFQPDLYNRGEYERRVTEKLICFECGRVIEKAGIEYHGVSESSRGYLHFHLKCANVVGQRLIMDTWPNRLVQGSGFGDESYGGLLERLAAKE